ncbi:YegJ family protein [Labrys monachus]|uniref:Uncharacterized protein YegJ (DUF2314 family) n=1 Tax=Labrys monachus TaxID=217067 RepID=A0ABU0FL61_9HYPH|nr:DUF2314 domain-containing protein [Labrys monachus]MDQ0395347.1 uncharacterized protein YegJ (DUF2314 family) [Labrys monachus]
MRRREAVLAGLAVLCLAAAQNAAPAKAETVQQKAKRHGMAKAPAGDPAMLAAFARAQRTLDGFVEALDGGLPGAGAFSVKIAVADRGKTEYFWINGLSHVGSRFSGTVNNRPEIVENVTFGQKLTFPRSQIRDWSYVKDGRMQGSFTTCVLLGREDPVQARELKAQIGLICE